MKERLLDLILILTFITVGYLLHTTINAIYIIPETTEIEVNLVGETNYSLGDLADFSANISNKKVRLVSGWKILKNNKEINFKALDDNNIIFPVGVEKANIQVLFHGAYIDPYSKKIKSTDFIFKNVTVGESVPTPPNPPVPPEPEPDNPTIPDGKYKISQMVYTTAVALVQSNNLPASANALSKSYRDVANNIIAKKYTTLKDVYADLKNKNENALSQVGEDINNWQSWDDAIRKVIANLHNTKKLTLTDHADIFLEISVGLSYIK